jgi:large subunit ribosomal protein L21
MYAIVEIKGKQYKAEKGALLKTALLPKSSGDSIEFDSVIMVSGNDNVQVGTPYVKGVTVKAKLESNKKDKKVIIYKYRPKKASKRKYGHRQPFSLIRVEEITGIKE